MRVATAVAILLAGSAARLPAQDGSLRGQVVRSDRPIGLADADVELRPSGARTRTDARGFFLFRRVAAGPAELAVHRVGFAPAVVRVQVNAATPTAVEIALEPVATILDPIVTVASRDPRSLSQVAAAVSVADTSAIRRNRTVGLHETLRMMPGVQVASRYGTEDVNIGIRGSTARARVAIRGVAVLLDGIPLTEPDGVARPDLIELAASRQVEVVRGPVSALYAGSPSGVVNVVSRTGRDSPSVSAGALGGAFGFRKYDGQAGGVFAGGRGSGFVAASYTWADGYRSHSDADIMRAQLALDYVAAPGTQIAIQANGSRLDSQLPGSQTQTQFDGDPDGVAPAAAMFGFGRDDNRYRAGTRIEQVVGKGIASGYFFYTGRTLESPNAGTITNLNLHRVQGGGRLRADRVARLPLDMTIGLDYDKLFGTDKRWQNVNGVPGALSGDGYLSVPNLGAYSQVEWPAAATATVTLGLRYDRVAYRFESYVSGTIPKQETTFDQLSPRLSGVWNPDSATSLYTSVGRGFEVPGIGELSPSPGAPISQSLRPKSLWNYEVGARRVVGSRLLLTGSVFYADVRGEFVPRTVDNMSRPENASRSRNAGVELGVTVRASRHVELVAGYTFLDPRMQEYASAVLDSTGMLQPVDFSGKLLPGVPRHRLTGEVRVSPVADLDFGVQVEWQSIVYVESSNADTGIWYFQPLPGAPVEQVPFRAVPGRALVHLNAAWRLGPATLFGTVENLFGLRYAGTVLANELLGRFYEAGPPSCVSVGLRVS
jgi:iron complex outermembrane recepter protein